MSSANDPKKCLIFAMSALKGRTKHNGLDSLLLLIQLFLSRLMF